MVDGRRRVQFAHITKTEANILNCIQSIGHETFLREATMFLCKQRHKHKNYREDVRKYKIERKEKEKQREEKGREEKGRERKRAEKNERKEK